MTSTAWDELIADLIDKEKFPPAVLSRELLRRTIDALAQASTSQSSQPTEEEVEREQYVGLRQDGMSADFGPTAMRRFTVFRRDVPDETHNADQKNAPDEPQFEGVVFSDGSVAVRWRTARRSTSVWTSLADLEAIHGHPEYGSVWDWHDAPR